MRALLRGIIAWGDSMLFRASWQEIALLLPALILALTFHELSHGAMALALGDSTAKRDGRLSLNPIKHIDPIGLLCILVIGFGWAKPVMVNPYNLRHPKTGMAFIALAGPFSNFIMALLCLLTIVPVVYFFPFAPNFVFDAAMTFASLNIMLGVFNLLPIPPLDGSKVIAGILPDSLYNRLPNPGPISMIILMVLALSGLLGRILMPLIQGVFGLMFNVAIDFWGVFLS